MSPRTLSRVFLCSVLISLLAALPMYAAVSETPGKGEQQRTPNRIERELPPIASDTGEVQYRTGGELERVILSGSKAQRHYQMLRQRRAAIFAKIEQKMRDRGLVPSKRVLVMIDRPAGSHAMGVSDDDGSAELDMQYYDDGTGQPTWQGSVYVENHDTGEIIVEDVQVDTSVASFPFLRDNIAYHQPPTIDPVSGSIPGGTAGSGSPTARRPVAEVNRHPHFKDFIACLLECCINWAGACIWTTMLWEDCFIIMCFLVCHNWCAIKLIFFN